MTTRVFVFEEPAPASIGAAIGADETELVALEPASKGDEVSVIVNPMITGTFADLLAAKGRFPPESKKECDLSVHADGTPVKGQLTNCIAKEGTVYAVSHNLPENVRIGLSFPGYDAIHSGGHAVVVGDTRGPAFIDPRIATLKPTTAENHFNVWHPSDLHPDITNRDDAGADVKTSSPIIGDLIENGYYDPKTGKTQEYSAKLFAGKDVASIPSAHIEASLARFQEAYDAAANVNIADYSPTFTLIPPPGKTLQQAFAKYPGKEYFIGCQAEVAFQTASDD